MIHPSAIGNTAGASALFFYVVIYMFMNLGAFGVTALVTWDAGSDDLESFSGLMRRSPWLAVPMILCLMSLVGIPPLAGFISKWWVLVALGSLERTATGQGLYTLGSLGWMLVVVVALNTLISLYYYMRIIVKMTLHDNGKPAMRTPISGLALVNICGIALLALTLLTPTLKRASDRVVEGMYVTAPDASQHAAVASNLPKKSN